LGKEVLQQVAFPGIRYGQAQVITWFTVLGYSR